MFIYQSASVSIFTVSAFILFTLTPYMSIPFNPIQQLIIISSIHYTIEMPSHSGETLCLAVMIHWWRNGHTGLFESSIWGSQHGLLSRPTHHTAALSGFELFLYLYI
jgi:hypothetical protein